MASPAAMRLTQLPEAHANFIGEFLRLFPRCKVAAFRQAVKVNQLRIRFLRPALRGSVVTCLGAKKLSLFSQYRRAEDTAVFVSQ
jgi:hypothetical protein